MQRGNLTKMTSRRENFDHEYRRNVRVTRLTARTVDVTLLTRARVRRREKPFRAVTERSLRRGTFLVYDSHRIVRYS